MGQLSTVCFSVWPSTCPAIALANVVDRANARVIQSRRRASFSLESFQGQRIMRQVVRKKFQGNEAAPPSVFDLIDHTHTAATELLHDTEMGRLAAAASPQNIARSVPRIQFGVEWSPLAQGNGCLTRSNLYVTITVR